MVKDCHNCEHHTWGDEWWNCKTECNKCKYTDMQGEKVPSNWKPLPTTNADRIRAMSDEELARFVANKIAMNIENHKMIEQGHTPTAAQLSALGHTVYCTLKQWLQQPAEGDA